MVLALMIKVSSVETHDKEGYTGISSREDFLISTEAIIIYVICNFMNLFGVVVLELDGHPF